MKKVLPAISFIAAVYFVDAQNTFTQVHQLLQTNCSGASCHSAGGNPSFDVTLSESALYAELVNGTPINPEALAKGDKLVDPGYVDRSFLLRKIAHGIADASDHLALKPLEGNPMPSGLAALKDFEIELIRQWILFGAPLTGNVVDTALINKYYRGKGINDTYPVHTPPAPGTGFQMYLGKIFVPPSTELEYFIKHDPRIPQSVEVNNVTTIMPTAAHHFVVFKYLQGQSGVQPNGLRPLTGSSHGETGDGIGSGPGYREFQLPTGTAYFWSANSVLDLNLHIRNNNTDSVLGTDLYVNIYTQPVGTATEYMFVRNFPVFTISIPQDGEEHEFTEQAFDSTETKMWKIWMLYSHTHRYGTDYDIWLRNLDGTKGSQVYEGFHNQEYTFDQGFYAWGVDVAIRYFQPFMQVDPRFGFIHRAKYRNTAGPDPVYWGDTSLDEMMVMGFQFVYGDELTPLSSSDLKKEPIEMNVFPNPALDEVTLNYVLERTSDFKFEITNVLGEVVTLIEQKNKPAGNYLEEIDLGNQFVPGLYHLTLYSNGVSSTRRIIIE